MSRHLLPTEIILLIIQHVNKRDLVNCAAIDRQFYAVVNPLLWRTIYIQHNNIGGHQFINSLVKFHHSLGQHIQSINLGNFIWTDTDLLRLIPHVSGLEELYINNGQRITDISFQLLPEHCPNLRSLHLYNSPITHLSMQALGQHCHQLYELELVDCSGLSPLTFSALVDCPLKQISIRGSSSNVSSSGGSIGSIGNIGSIDSSSSSSSGGGGTNWMTAAETAVDLATHFPQLTYLMIWTGGDRSSSFDDFIRFLFWSATWPHLSFLSLDTCHGMDDDTLIPFIQSHSHLKDLTLQGSDFSDITLDAIADSLPDVVHMDVSCSRHISAGGLRRCVERCLCLRSVYVFRCGLKSDAFPEVDEDGVRFDSYRGLCGMFLVELDKVAIDKIRLDPGEPTAQTDNFDVLDAILDMIEIDIDEI